jgi:transposase
MALTLTTDERTELERRASSRTIRAEDAKRAKVILMLADGTSYSTIEATLWCYRDYINRWRQRFVAGRLDGLRSAHKGQKPSVLTPALEARILAKTQQRPPDGSTHGSTRKLARVLKIHHNHVQTAWTRARMQPHRFERSMQSDDPDFEPHFTPTSASWLNQVELWFGRIERELLTRGLFTSVKDLARQIRRYIRHDNDVAKPIRWKYADPTRRITGSTSARTGH